MRAKKFLGKFQEIYKRRVNTVLFFDILAKCREFCEKASRRKNHGEKIGVGVDLDEGGDGNWRLMRSCYSCQ